MEERRQALDVRKKVLEEKNRLAEENERIRKVAQTEKRTRSEKALKNLIDSRKRRR